ISRGPAMPCLARSAPTSSKDWAPTSSAESTATISPSWACRCCLCYRSWPVTALGWGGPPERLRDPAEGGTRTAVRRDRRLAGRALALARVARLLAEAAQDQGLLRPATGRTDEACAPGPRRLPAAHTAGARLQPHPAAQDPDHAASGPHPSGRGAHRCGEHGGQTYRRLVGRPQQRWLRLPRRTQGRCP